MVQVLAPEVALLVDREALTGTVARADLDGAEIAGTLGVREGLAAA
jgi:hypothetical protein